MATILKMTGHEQASEIYSPSDTNPKIIQLP